MLNGAQALPSISLPVFLSFNENAHVKDGHICDKAQYSLQEKLLLIGSYSCRVTNYFENKDDHYS